MTGEYTEKVESIQNLCLGADCCLRLFLILLSRFDAQRC